MDLFRHKRSPYWQCSYYDHNGKLKKRSTRCTDKKAATTRATLWEREAADPHSAQHARATLEDAMTLLIKDRNEQARVGKKSPDTAAFYARKAGQLLRYFEHDGKGLSPRVPFPLADLTADRVDDYVSFRRSEAKHPHSKEKVSESTISKELICLRAALKLAKRRGLWGGDIAEVMPVGFSPEYKPRERFLTYDELQKLLAQLTPDRAARVAFIVATSACWRETELAKRSDIEDNQVKIRGTKTAQRFRTVPIALSFQRQLLEYTQKFSEGEKDMLFVPWGNVRRDLHAACERIKIPSCSANDLRRTCATWMRAQGVLLELLPPVMGHRDGKMIERVYGRMNVADLSARIKVSASSNSTPNPSDRLVLNRPNGREKGGAQNAATPQPEGTGAGLDVCPETELNRRHGDFQSPILLLPNPSNSPHLVKYKRQRPPIVRQASDEKKGSTR